MLAFPDRFWWAQRVWGVLLALAALGFLVWLVVQALGFFNFAGLGTGWSMLLALLVIGVLLAIVIGVGALQLAMPLLMGLGYLMGASPARDRFERRRKAIQGDQEAVPRAKLQVDAAHAPRLAGGALELIWWPTALLRVVVALMDLVFLPVFGLFAGLGVYITYEIVGTNQEAGLFWLARVGLLLLVVGTLVVAPLVVLGILLCSALVVLGKPFGLVADDAGIAYRSALTRRRYILRWEDIGLFEVQPALTAGQTTFRLYGRGVIARWNNQPPSKGSMPGLTKAEFEERHQALLDLIAARTGLLPRTFDKELQEDASA